VVWRTDAPVPPNVATVEGGTPDAFTVEPALPDGLSLHPSSGAISGTPLTPWPATVHTVTAANGDGSADADVTIEVVWAEWKSLAPRAGLGDADLRHFLRRTHWTAEDEDLAAIESRGLEPYVDAMLVFPPRGQVEPFEAEARLKLLDPADPPGQEGLFPSYSDLSQWHIALLMGNPNPFQEVLGMFWHDHFATSSSVLEGGRVYYMEQHVNMLRDLGTGNARDLVEAVARDWAMLWWLDGRISTKFAPNENFGREFCELFCLGVDNGYTQEDIVELSKVFTGYQDVVLDSESGLRQIVWNPSRHDESAKAPFGVTIPAGGGEEEYRTAVDVTFDHRPVAEWLARSILSRFVYVDPAPELVDQVAALLRAEGDELAPVLKAVFLSEAFYSDRAKEGLVKGPVEFTMGFMQATDLPVVRLDGDRAVYVLDTRAVEAFLEALAQEPTNPPSVNGWPGGGLWLSAQGMVDRANFVRTVIVDRTDQANAGIDLRDLLPPGSPSAAEVLDDVALHLGVTLTPTEHADLVTYLDTTMDGSGNVVMGDPLDVGDPQHVSERVRGLLYILAQHPTYMKR
jgi:hypothetical protein